MHQNEHPVGDASEEIEASIERAIAGAKARVEGGGGHYVIEVTAAAFEGRTVIECHRLVHAAIAPLMTGPNAPVHAIDSLRTLKP